jgi:hypothetical protein
MTMVNTLVVAKLGIQKVVRCIAIV